MPNDLKHIQASLSLIPIDWLCLRVAQVPRCRDLAISVVTTDRLTDYFTPAHARGVITASSESEPLQKCLPYLFEQKPHPE